MVVFSYARLVRWPVRQLFRGCGAWIHARHLIHSLVAPQTMATSSPEFVGCTPHLHTMTMLEAGTVWQTNPRKGEAVLTF